MTGKRLIVGVLGGMGPEATVDFMSKVIALTPAERDQDHVRMLVDHNPTVPDRQIDTAEQRDSVKKALADMAVGLEQAGADFLVIPCNTAHGFIDEAVSAVSIPLVHIVTETVRESHRVAGDSSSVGLLATDACLRAGLYNEALVENGQRPILPDEDAQAHLMQLVGRIKSGDRSTSVQNTMTEIASALISSGAGVVVAGCTEIPMVLSQDSLAVPLISSTDVLAQRTVDICLGNQSLPDTHK
jgi:aspartate racemase